MVKVCDPLTWKGVPTPPGWVMVAAEVELSPQWIVAASCPRVGPGLAEVKVPRRTRPVGVLSKPVRFVPAEPVSLASITLTPPPSGLVSVVLDPPRVVMTKLRVSVEPAGVSWL